MGPFFLIRKNRDWPLWAILIAGFIFRVIFLDHKPPHFDEGINGWFVDQLILRGYYPYDPTNYHGPLHFYILFIFKFLLGRNLWALRLSSSFFGLASVWMMTRFKPFVGKFIAYGAALFTAVSPGMIFYSRYGIHESALLFFSLLALWGYFRLCTQGDKKSLWAIGMGVAGMILTKETYILHLACFALALLCLQIYESYFPSVDAVGNQGQPRYSFTSRDVWIVSGTSVFIILFFYSGFFQSLAGVIDLFRSLVFWANTGEKGNGHGKPFIYWFFLFARYEWIALAGLVLSFILLWPASRFLRLIGIYGIGVFLAYSLVNYKTPWCVLQIIWPFHFVAAAILQRFARHGRRNLKIAAGAAVALAVVCSGESIRLNFFHNTDETEPYVYVQTFPDVMRMYNRLKTLFQRDPSYYHIPITVVMNSHWPLPWLLGDFTKVLYYPNTHSGEINGVLVLCDSSVQKEVEKRLKKNYFYEKIRWRAAQEDAMGYYDAEVFKEFFSPQAPMVKPPGSLP